MADDEVGPQKHDRAQDRQDAGRKDTTKGAELVAAGLATIAALGHGATLLAPHTLRGLLPGAGHPGELHGILPHAVITGGTRDVVG